MCVIPVSPLPFLYATETVNLSMNWAYLRKRMKKFASNLAITDLQLADGITKCGEITAALNRNYYDDNNSKTDNCLIVGSWGKDTKIAPPFDVDMIYFLPASVYYRFEEREGNKQSQLLQEVRQVLSDRYSTTARIRGDNQVVQLPFNTLLVEVVPAFKLDNGQSYICNTPDGGKYKTISPEAELNNIAISDSAHRGNTRALIKMLKAWKKECNVPIKSFQLELLAVEFISRWEYRLNDSYWWDWMIRDFFSFMSWRANGSVSFPVTGETSPLGNDWHDKCNKAYEKAVIACELERDNKNYDAGSKWQEIFGTAVPLVAT